MTKAERIVKLAHQMRELRRRLQELTEEFRRLIDRKVGF
ncbi:hypothetical protein LCGC14_2018350 [marine sediment metagenome]|uniref:Uncharacterized protein n=1 Tax=marine sediment metagenome TaxID=412755 RepID=A0A0F9EYA7_9ZZZZ